MSRAERLLELVQLLRQHRSPVGAARLAQALEVSPRTLYRDIAALRAQGASIDGEPGVGYLLRPGFMLPPLMFREDEIEALVLGMRWVMDRADAPLGQAARSVLARIAAVLPADLKAGLDDVGLLVVPAAADEAPRAWLTAIREAIRAERKLTIAYRDGGGQPSRRVVWPLAVGFSERVRVLAAWCELRQDFRHFRLDRIGELAAGPGRYPRRRKALLHEWREKHNIPPP